MEYMKAIIGRIIRKFNRPSAHSFIFLRLVSAKIRLFILHPILNIPPNAEASPLYL